MRVTIVKADVREALGMVKHCLPEKPLIEVDGHIRLEMDKDCIMLRATDGMISAKIAVLTVANSGFEDDQSIEFPMDPKRFEKAITKNESEDTVDIEWIEEDKSVRIYTRSGKNSYITLPTMDMRKMCKFPDIVGYSAIDRGPITSLLMAEAMTFVSAYLPALREDGRAFDLAVIDKGIAYGCNGINKRGYLVAKALKPFNAMPIHKKYVLRLSKIMRATKKSDYSLSQDDKRVMLESSGGEIVITLMKSRKLPSEVNSMYIKSVGAYCQISKPSLIKSLDRSTIASFEKTGHPIGIQLKLSGEGGQAELNTQLVTGNKLDTVDSIPCERKNDGADEVEHVIDYKLFKTVVSSMSSSENIRLYVNDPELKYFKVYSADTIDDETYALIGVGAYSRITR